MDVIALIRQYSRNAEVEQVQKEVYAWKKRNQYPAIIPHFGLGNTSLCGSLLLSTPVA
jgi:hypothetical protein